MIKQIFRLCRLQMCNMFGINEFRYTKDKSRKKRFILLSCSWLILIMMLMAYVVGLSYGLIKMGAGNVLPMYLYTVVSILMLVFTFFKAGSVLFSMKGYEMLTALPVSKAAIVISRFMTMHMSNLLMSCLVMIPGAVVYGIMEGPGIMFYAVYLTGTVFLPLLPLTIASVIGAVIKAISSRMRHKSMVEALLMIMLILAVFGAGMLLSGGDNDFSMEMLKNTESLKNIIMLADEQIGKIYPPALWFNRAVFGNVEYMAGFVVISLMIFVIFVAVLQKYFQNICTLLNGVSSKNNYKIQAMKAHGVVKALWKKELKRYFSSSIYVTNTIIGYVLAVVAAVSLYVMGTDKIEEMMGISGISPMIETVLPFIFALCMSIMPMTSCSISLEGKNLWIVQTMPVKGKDVYLSKILANLTVAVPFYVVCVIMGCLTIDFSLTEYLWMALIPACYAIYMAVVGITVNLAFPVFNWDSEVQAVKQGVAVLISMIAGLVSCIAPAAAVILLGENMADVSRMVTVLVVTAVTVVLYKMNGKKELQGLGGK